MSDKAEEQFPDDLPLESLFINDMNEGQINQIAYHMRQGWMSRKGDTPEKEMSR